MIYLSIYLFPSISLSIYPHTHIHTQIHRHTHTHTHTHTHPKVSHSFTFHWSINLNSNSQDRRPTIWLRKRERDRERRRKKKKKRVVSVNPSIVVRRSPRRPSGTRWSHKSSILTVMYPNERATRLRTRLASFPPFFVCPWAATVGFSADMVHLDNCSDLVWGINHHYTSLLYILR